MKNKEKLKKLVQIFGDLLKEEGNDWLIDEILKTIGDISPVEEMAKHSLIQSIHEYCIEQKIEKQSKDFYASFPIAEIKDQLIQDYRKMEHERRRDDFEGFSLTMFQQLEAIVNFCFESNHIRSNLQKDRNSSAFIIWDDERKIWERNSTQRLVPFLLLKTNPERNSNSSKYNPDSNAPFYEINEKKENAYFEDDGRPVIDWKPSKETWKFSNRFRTILFYYYFNSELKPFEINNIYDSGFELYTIRNQNHRESKASEKQQRIIDKVCGNEARYYFKFYGFLQDFVSRIELSYTPERNSGYKQTLGDSNPELEIIKRKMEKNESKRTTN